MTSNGIQQKYEKKCGESFQTKLNVYLFYKCIKSDIQTANIDDFMSFKITDEIVDKYAAVYFQEEYDYKIDGGISVNDVWKEMEGWKRRNEADLAIMEEAYRKAFSSILPFNFFQELVGRKECEYCRITLAGINALLTQRKIFKKSNRGFKIEIDRKSPNKEYMKDNVVACCYWCNNAKTDEFSYKEFKDVVGPAMAQVWKARTV